MLKLHKIIKKSHSVVSPIDFLVFYQQVWQGEVFKVMKNDHFLVFLAIWVLFPKFLGRLSIGYVGTAQNNKSVTCSCVPNLFCCSCVMSKIGREEHVQSYENLSFFVFSRLGLFFSRC